MFNTGVRRFHIKSYGLQFFPKHQRILFILQRHIYLPNSFAGDFSSITHAHLWPRLIYSLRSNRPTIPVHKDSRDVNCKCQLHPLGALALPTQINHLWASLSIQIRPWYQNHYGWNSILRVIWWLNLMLGEFSSTFVWYLFTLLDSVDQLHDLGDKALHLTVFMKSLLLWKLKIGKCWFWLRDKDRV